MSISKTKEEFDDLFQRKYHSKPIQLQFEFEEDLQNQPQNTVDDFDIGMKKILGYTIDED